MESLSKLDAAIRTLIIPVRYVTDNRLNDKHLFISNTKLYNILKLNEVNQDWSAT